MLPVLQSDWIAVCAATVTTQCIALDRASARVWLRETTLLHAWMNRGYVARTHCSLARIMVRFGPIIIFNTNQVYISLVAEGATPETGH